MAVIRKKAVVPFSAEEMYELVNDVESYPEFLPWCSETQVHSKTENESTASLSLAVGKIRQKFSTENTMIPGRRISVRLISGPFKFLNGSWEFEPEDDRKCKISLDMNFEFKNKLLKMTLDKLITHILNSLVEAFTERARQLYGSR